MPYGLLYSINHYICDINTVKPVVVTPVNRVKCPKPITKVMYRSVDHYSFYFPTPLRGDARFARLGKKNCNDPLPGTLLYIMFFYTLSVKFDLPMFLKS